MARTLAAACLALTVLLFALPAIAQQPDPVLADIVIEGNTKTDLAVVRRVIGLEIGDPFPMEAFDGVWDRLEDCGYFAFVDIDTEEDDAGRVTLLVTLAVVAVMVLLVAWGFGRVGGHDLLSGA